MKTLLNTTLMIAALLAATQAAAKVTLYELEGYGGRSVAADRDVRNLRQYGFNNQASSAVIDAGRWEVCERPRFEGRCTVLRPGRYGSLAAMGIGNRISSLREVGVAGRERDSDTDPRVGAPASGGAPLTFYEREGFRGRSFSSAQDVDNFAGVGFNDSAASAIITGGPWEVCEDAYHRGRCITLAPGRYRSLAALGIDGRISSARQHDGQARRDDRQGRPPSTGITLFEREGFAGRWYNAMQPVDDLQPHGFSDRAASAIVSTGVWEVCADARYGGGCAVLLPGEYPSLAQTGLQGRITSLRQGDRWSQNEPDRRRDGAVVFYEGENLTGPSFRLDAAVPDFQRAGLYGRARSAEVSGTSWRVCGMPLQGGSCTVLRPGVYPSLQAMGLRDQVASLHQVHPAVDEDRWFSGQQPPSGTPIGRQIR